VYNTRERIRHDATTKELKTGLQEVAMWIIREAVTRYREDSTSK
jgi:hypothetical protein